MFHVGVSCGVQGIKGETANETYISRIENCCNFFVTCPFELSSGYVTRSVRFVLCGDHRGFVIALHGQNKSVMDWSWGNFWLSQKYIKKRQYWKILSRYFLHSSCGPTHDPIQIPTFGFLGLGSIFYFSTKLQFCFSGSRVGTLTPAHHL